MRDRILCPNPDHKEKTPSFVLYDDYGYCYACGYRAPLSELGGDIPRRSEKPRPVNLDEELAYIKGLPLASIRGLSLPVDSEFYYILWPNAPYYKKRRFIDSSGQKYLCPTGHAKPLFQARNIRGQGLAIVEGEINALSLSSINPSFSVCSPGGAADFFGKNCNLYLKYYLTFSVIYVIVDKDKAGVEAAIKLKGKLLQSGLNNVSTVLMERDCNDLLVSGELGEFVEKMGMR